MGAPSFLNRRRKCMTVKRKIILTSDYKDHKVGETIELDADEASLAINTGFGRLTEETAKAEAEQAKKQAEVKPTYTPYNPPSALTPEAAKLKKAEEDRKAEEARKAEAAKKSHK